MSNQPSNAWLTQFAKFLSLANDPKLAKVLSGAARDMNQAADRFEKAAGGKKRLDMSVEILADAEDNCTKHVAVAERKAVQLVAVANEQIRLKEERLAGNEREFEERHAKLEKAAKIFVVDSGKVDDRETVVEGREAAADTRDRDLDRRDLTLADREARCETRHRELEDRARRMTEAAAPIA